MARVSAMQRELHARMLTEKGPDEPRENVLRNRGRNSKGEVAREFSDLRAKFLLRFGGERRDFVCVAQQK